MEVQHARPVRPARHSRGVRAVLLRPRFGMLALLPAVALGLGSGALTGLAARPEAVVPAADAAAMNLTASDADGAVGEASGEEDASSAEEAPDEAELSEDLVAAAEAAEAALAAGIEPTSQVVPLADLVPELDADRDPAVPAGLSAADAMAGLLSLETPASAGGDLVVVPGSAPAPDPDAPVRTVRIEVEAGLPIDGEKFATLVMGILNNPQGWGADGRLSFARTDGNDQDLRVVLASPDKVDSMCAPLATNGTYSCGRYGHAAINYTRWVSGATAFDDMTTYRQYVINHEVGHLLGHPHVGCPAPGVLAPIMVQQTITVGECVANGWPYPDEA